MSLDYYISFLGEVFRDVDWAGSYRGMEIFFNEPEADGESVVLNQRSGGFLERGRNSAEIHAGSRK